MKNCVYRFINENNEIIYIGKAKDLKSRLKSHTHLPKECYVERSKVEYITFESEDDMDFAERYFVPKEKPKYNTVYKYRKLNVNIDEFDNMQWQLLETHTTNTKIKNYNECLILDRYITDKKQGLKLDDLRFIQIKKEMQNDINELKNKMLINKIKDKVIVNADTGEMFENMQEAAIAYDLYIEDIYDIVEHGRFYKYKHPKYFDASLRLMYCDTFKENYKANPQLFDNKIEKYTKKVICLSNDNIYSNIYEASCKLNITSTFVLSSCLKAQKYNNDGKIDFDFAWYDDYKHMLIFTA